MGGIWLLPLLVLVLEIDRLCPQVSPLSATMAGEEGPRPWVPGTARLTFAPFPPRARNRPRSRTRTGPEQDTNKRLEQDLNRTWTGAGQDANRTRTGPPGTSPVFLLARPGHR